LCSPKKEEALLKGTLGRQFSKDPYPDSTKMEKFIADTEKLAKLVESLLSSSEELIEDEECCLCNLNSGWLVFEPDLECVFSG
jgi:hypothetical protein